MSKSSSSPQESAPQAEAACFSDCPIYTPCGETWPLRGSSASSLATRRRTQSMAESQSQATGKTPRVLGKQPLVLFTRPRDPH